MLGAVVIVVALVGAVVMFLVGRSRIDQAVQGLARAPVGCDTTLEFSGTGTFVVFVETTGRIDQLDGGCDAPTTYDRRSAGVPAVTIEISGPASQDVAVTATDVEGYDIAGFTGTPSGEVEIGEDGRYVVRVSSPDDDFAVAIGRDPDRAARPLWIAAVLMTMAGLVGGATLVVIGITRSRRDSLPPEHLDQSPPPAFVADVGAPTAPPLAPPPGTTVTPPTQDPEPWAPPSGDPVAPPWSDEQSG
ncbi:hypothetical protein BH23ACT3_BH23ACT3_21200 [soil metagenome]